MISSIRTTELNNLMGPCVVRLDRANNSIHVLIVASANHDICKYALPLLCVAPMRYQVHFSKLK